MVPPELHAAWVECGRCCTLEHWAGIIEGAEVGEQFPTSPRRRGWPGDSKAAAIQT